MIKVGRFTCTREWQKIAFNNPPNDVKYFRALDIPFASLGINNPFLHHTKFHFGSFIKGLDFLHTYNGIIPYGPDWIIEVEDSVPRYGRNASTKQINYATKRLQSDSCKCISFTSEMAYNLNREFLKNHGLESKAIINYRAVHIPNIKFKPKFKSNTFNIVFVGNAFYRKGGIELLKAFVNNPHRSDWNLDIISSFEVDWSVYPNPEQILWVHSVIANDKRISVYKSIEHNEVYKILHKSHVFISTTFADTWNNAILESLVNGIPVIASNIAVIPEMVQNNVNGYLIDINKTSNEISNEIELAINKYYDDVNLLNTHSKNAYRLSREKFSLTRRNNILAKIFNK